MANHATDLHQAPEAADEFRPAYLALLDSGELDRRVSTAWAHLEKSEKMSSSGSSHRLTAPAAAGLGARVGSRGQSAPSALCGAGSRA